MPLDSKAVDWIFGRMTARYGAAWLAKWNGVPMDSVRADWAQQLSGVRRDAVLYAMCYLPADHPPNVAQFLAICRRAPDATPQLAAPGETSAPLDPQRLAALLARARQLQAKRAPLQWAVDLQERERRGEELSLVQRKSWRHALQRHDATGIVGGFTPIDPGLLPPGMRPKEWFEEPSAFDLGEVTA